MKVKFWGVRGSIPTPWEDAMQVGGNTTCVQVSARDDLLMILDAGTGLRLLGDQLSKSATPVKGHLLLTHAHWDHIQGFPFFAPVYNPNNHFVIYGADHAQRSLEEILRGQMTAPYFPVEFAQAGAQLDFKSLAEESFLIEDVKVTTCSFQHPGGVYGFRIEYADQSIVFATDMEYTEDTLDQRLIDFAEGADLLIYDSQYTPEEFAQKIGWGHSTHIAAAHLAQRAHVKHLMLFHHDPSHSDQQLRQMEKEAQAIFASSQLATEGLLIDLDLLP